MAGVLLAFVSVLAVCVFLVLKCKIPAGFAPIVVLSMAALWFSAAGMLDVLWAGGLVWFLVCGAALVFALAYKPKQNEYKKLLSPAFLLFALAGLCAVLYMGIRQPLLHEWDEYSLWGAVVKIMKVNNELYTTAPSGFAWLSTQMPTLPALAYFVQFFGAYAAWKTYAAYALLLLSVVSALVGAVPMRQYQLAVPLGIIGLLTPWFFTVYTRQYEAAFVWLSGYGDMPAGMLFGGVLLLYYGLRGQKRPLWPVAPVLAALALVKENTFVFALAAAGVVTLDLLFAPQNAAIPQNNRGQGAAALPGKEKLLKRGGYSALFLAVPAAAYVLWSRYIGGVVAARQAAGVVDPASESPFAALGKGVAMLLKPETRSEWFSQTLAAMWDSFFWQTTDTAAQRVPGGAPISMVGGGLVVVALVTLLFLAAFVLAKQNRRRIALAYGGALLCFVAYSFELLVSYAFILGEGQGLIPSYNRYIVPYYIGWFLLAVAFVAQAAGRQNPRPAARGAAQGVALALAAVMLLRSSMLLPLQNSDIGYPQAALATQRAEQKFADEVARVLGDEPQRLFFVSQGDDFGEGWFTFHYLMLPHIIDYSGVSTKTGGAGGGGGTYITPQQLPDGEDPKAYNMYTPQEMQEYITESGCTYTFIQTLDDQFVQGYGGLFTDGLQRAKNGETVLYKVEGGGKNLRLSPVQMEVAGG